ncbi:NRT1/ PTR family 1.2-like protein [Tanacetum coccineum]
MGAGLVFSILEIEEKAIEEGFYNDSQAVVKMSTMWLVPQQVFHGLSEALNIIGIRSLLDSLILSSVNAITKQDGKVSWVSTNINKDRTMVKGQNANNAGEEDAPTC